jgi:hypothetical protein
MQQALQRGRSNRLPSVLKRTNPFPAFHPVVTRSFVRLLFSVLFGPAMPLAMTVKKCYDFKQ